MNDSKKLLYIKIVGIIIVLLFISFFLFLIIKIDFLGHIFNNKSYIRVATGSNLYKYLEDVNSREYKEKVRDKDFIEKSYEEKEVIEEDKSIFKYINRIKNNRSNTLSKKNSVNVDVKKDNSKKQNDKIYEIDRNRIQKIYDNGYYNKNSWLLIDEDYDSYGYNYYFDEKGKLLYDTISPDYKIIDRYGREVDDDLEPILYNIEQFDNIPTVSNADIERIGLVSENVIVTERVTIKNSDSVYDNQMNRNVIDYIDKSLRFKKRTNGTIYGDIKWKNVSSIKNDGGYVIFNNEKNNFNKIVGKVAIEKIKENEDINITFLVYDADLYELYNGYEYLIDPLYETKIFNNEPSNFSFSFFRTVKRLRFQIESDDNKKVTCYLKDLKFGFNKQSYKEELIEAKDNEEYIKYLKELGIYKTDEEILLEIKALEEDSQSDYLEYEDFNDIDLYDDIDLSSYERNYNKEQRFIDRKTGPAFDEYLKNLKNYWEIEYGPEYVDK